MRIRLSLLSLSVLLLWGCGEEKKAAMGPPTVKVVEVETQEIPITADFVGQTYGLFDIAIRARVEGFLEGRYFQEGSTVKEGELLYTIDAQPFQAKVVEQESNLARAKTALAKAEADFNRVKPLAESNAVSQSDLDAATAQLNAAKAEVKAEEAALRSSKIDLSYTRIFSPIDGIIGITEAKVGDFVGREPNPVVLNAVSRTDTILVRFSITETQYLSLVRFQQMLDSLEEEEHHEMETIKLILADGTFHNYPGRFDFANRNIDPNTGTLLLQASFPNPSGLVRPGQFARVRILVYTVPDGIMIPQRCIKETQGLFDVVVVNDQGETEQRRVEVGPEKGNMRIVESGLQVGDKIVYEGLQRTRSGVKVNPEVVEVDYISHDG